MDKAPSKQERDPVTQQFLKVPGSIYPGKHKRKKRRIKIEKIDDVTLVIQELCKTSAHLAIQEILSILLGPECKEKAVTARFVIDKLTPQQVYNLLHTHHSGSLTIVLDRGDTLQATTPHTLSNTEASKERAT